MRALHSLRGAAETIGLARIAQVAAGAEGMFRRTGKLEIAPLVRAIEQTSASLLAAKQESAAPRAAA